MGEGGRLHTGILTGDERRGYMSAKILDIYIHIYLFLYLFICMYTSIHIYIQM